MDGFLFVLHLSYNFGTTWSTFSLRSYNLMRDSNVHDDMMMIIRPFGQRHLGCGRPLQSVRRIHMNHICEMYVFIHPPVIACEVGTIASACRNVQYLFSNRKTASLFIAMC